MHSFGHAWTMVVENKEVNFPLAKVAALIYIHIGHRLRTPPLSLPSNAPRVLLVVGAEAGRSLSPDPPLSI